MGNLYGIMLRGVRQIQLQMWGLLAFGFVNFIINIINLGFTKGWW